jgi:HEPN domain-containing protein
MNAPPEELATWLSKASADLEAARHLRTRADLPVEIACFHYQQAAEKALKGVLVAAGTAPPWIHNLRALLASFQKPPAGIEPETAESLTPFAVLARYPGFREQPDAATVDRFDAFAARCVELLRAAVEPTPSSMTPSGCA